MIGAWTSNNGKFSSLMVGVHKNGHLAYTGNVGTGYGAETVKRIMPALKAAAASKSPFGGPERAERRTRYSLAET